jgi:DNA-binding transcriptional LysR family regulator
MPEIHIERAYAEDQERSVQYLRSGLVDLAFAASPKIKSIHSDVFYRDPVLLAVSHTHPLAKKKHIIPSDLKHIPLCLPIRADRLRSPMNEFLKMIGTKINIILETNDYTLMRNLIEKDHCAGFVYLHNMITEDRESGIVPLRIPELSIIRDLTILYRRDDIAPHVERTKDVLIEEAKIILDKTKKRLRIL